MAAATRLAFVEVCTAEADTLRAGLLLTDGAGDPLDFRATSPVRPTRLHRTLWGARLTGHLLAEVFGRPLVDSLPAPPDLILVRQRPLLDLRATAGRPVVQVLTAADGTDCYPLPGGPPPVPAGQPWPAFLRAARADELDPAVRLVARLAAGLHPAEPFGRVTQAVAAVHQDEARGRGA